jgi:PHD/YefM family antitoxin component YafN of YafNO toxin-antitoxin module
MKTIELSQATKPLADYASELGTEAIVLTSDDRPVAALLSLEGVDKESLALSTNPEFLEIIAAARREIQRGETLSLEEMKAAAR